MDRAARRWLGTTLLGLCISCAEAHRGLEARQQLHAFAVAVNLARLEQGLPPLKLNDQLCEAAQRYAETLLQMGQVRHADALGRRADYRATVAGYFYHRLGENLAAGQLSWERALAMWLESPPHRANLLDPDYRELGVGFSADDRVPYRTAWTQLLGARRHVYPVIINLEAFATHSREVEVYLHGAHKAWAMRYRINEGAWSDWQSPVQRLSCRLPAQEGFHSVTVQLRIGERVYEASDEIYLQSGLVLAEVACDGERHDPSCAGFSERAGAGIERAPGGEHIIQQGAGTPFDQPGGYYRESVLHILYSLGLAQSHLRAAIESATERVCLHRDS